MHVFTMKHKRKFMKSFSKSHYLQNAFLKRMMIFLCTSRSYFTKKILYNIFVKCHESFFNRRKFLQSKIEIFLTLGHLQRCKKCSSKSEGNLSGNINMPNGFQTSFHFKLYFIRKTKRFDCISKRGFINLKRVSAVSLKNCPLLSKLVGEIKFFEMT